MDVELVQLQSHGDGRGALVALEQGKNIPFEIKRVYYIFDTKSGVRRGFHAHKELKQITVAVRGSCRFLLDNGKEKTSILLNNPAQGLLIGAYVWREMYEFSEDCVLVVLASNLYDESDYIRDYTQFKDVVKRREA